MRDRRDDPDQHDDHDTEGMPNPDDLDLTKKEYDRIHTYLMRLHRRLGHRSNQTLVDFSRGQEQTRRCSRWLAACVAQRARSTGVVILIPWRPRTSHRDRGE